MHLHVLIEKRDFAEFLLTHKTNENAPVLHLVIFHYDFFM